MAFRSAFPFGTQREAQQSALDRMGPPSPTVGGASVSVGMGAKKAALRYQRESLGQGVANEFSKMRQEDPAAVDAWRAKALGGRYFRDDFMPELAANDGENSGAAGAKPKPEAG